ncbi:hypothetical protein P5Z58_13560, partial [Limosilactobacillus mucosae]|nr:hypothetical protein [Limosilactobacillus mucosae]
VGSYVSYKDRKYIVYEVNGSVLSLTDGKTPIEVKAKDVTVEGGYAIAKYGKSTFIVSDSKKVISTVTGKQVFGGSKIQKTK